MKSEILSVPVVLMTKGQRTFEYKIMTHNLFTQQTATIELLTYPSRARSLPIVQSRDHGPISLSDIRCYWLLWMVVSRQCQPSLVKIIDGGFNSWTAHQHCHLLLGVRGRGRCFSRKDELLPPDQRSHFVFLPRFFDPFQSSKLVLLAHGTQR